MLYFENDIYLFRFYYGWKKNIYLIWRSHLWQIPIPWMCARALANWYIYIFTEKIGIDSFLLLKYFATEYIVSGIYSNTKFKYWSSFLLPFVTKCCFKPTMNGCGWATSCRIIWSSLFLNLLSCKTFLMATISSVSTTLARKTAPNDPCPIMRWASKWNVSDFNSRLK